MVEAVTLVLARADGPMRAREIHAAAEVLAGETLLWTSVKAALAAGTSGHLPRFQRVRHGVYQSARTLAQDFSAPVDRLPERVAALRADLSAARADADALRARLADQLVAAAPAEGTPPLRLLTLDDAALLAPVLTAVPADEVLAAVGPGGRCGVASGHPDVKAGDVLRAALAVTGGKGGGKPELAQGSTADEEGFLGAVRQVL